MPDRVGVSYCHNSGIDVGCQGINGVEDRLRYAAGFIDDHQDQALLEAARVVAARPTACWDGGSSAINSHLNAPLPAVRETLLAHVKDWNTDPRDAAKMPLRA